MEYTHVFPHAFLCHQPRDTLLPIRSCRLDLNHSINVAIRHGDNKDLYRRIYSSRSMGDLLGGIGHGEHVPSITIA